MHPGRKRRVLDTVKRMSQSDYFSTEAASFTFSKRTHNQMFSLISCRSGCDRWNMAFDASGKKKGVSCPHQNSSSQSCYFSTEAASFGEANSRIIKCYPWFLVDLAVTVETCLLMHPGRKACVASPPKLTVQVMHFFDWGSEFWWSQHAHYQMLDLSLISCRSGCDRWNMPFDSSRKKARVAPSRTRGPSHAIFRLRNIEFRWSQHAHYQMLSLVSHTCDRWNMPFDSSREKKGVCWIPSPRGRSHACYFTTDEPRVLVKPTRALSDAILAFSYLRPSEHAFWCRYLPRRIACVAYPKLNVSSQAIFRLRNIMFRWSQHAHDQMPSSCYPPNMPFDASIDLTRRIACHRYLEFDFTVRPFFWLRNVNLRKVIAPTIRCYPWFLIPVTLWTCVLVIEIEFLWFWCIYRKKNGVW